MTETTEQREGAFIAGIVVGVALMGTLLAFSIGFHQFIGTLTITGPVVDKVPFQPYLNLTFGAVGIPTTLYVGQLLYDDYVADSSTRVDA